MTHGSEPTSRVAGIVPAAGASRRMGRPKGLLRIDGATFAQRVVRALRDGGCRPIYVVVDAEDEELAVHARGTGADVVTNTEPGEGPITSLRLALARVADAVDAVVYLPLDHALVDGGHVTELIEAAREADAALALPMYGSKRGHPAFFGRSLFPELLDPDLEGGARTVVHRHLDEACVVRSDDPAVVTDIDTPEAYRDALRLHRTGRAG